jgi:hypothetical protein
MPACRSVLPVLTTTVLSACRSVLPGLTTTVMPGLVPGIHANATVVVFAWMARSGPAMTIPVPPERWGTLRQKRCPNLDHHARLPLRHARPNLHRHARPNHHRHARPCAGYPRERDEVGVRVDGRVKPGHDGRVVASSTNRP